MSEMNATFQPGVVLDVMTLYLGNKFLVRNDTDLLKMWKMSDVENLWDVHFYIEQKDEVPLGIVDPIDLDAIPEALLIDSDDDAPIKEIATQVEPIVYNIQAQKPKKLVTKPSDGEVIVENTDVGGNTVGEGVEDMGGSTIDREHRGGVGDMIENINRCDLEFRDLAKEYDAIFVEEEDAVYSVPPQPTYGELRVGMEWATVVRLFCKDENCEWMFYARRTTDGHTFTLRKNSNLKHTCSSGAKNRLANATWVAKQVESVMSEKIVGSYDEGYIMQLELCLQILHSNPGNIAVVSKDRLVLVPKAQTHIDKLKRQYGQYRIEGTKKGDVPYRYSWANFVSEYHKVSSYVKTYKDAIYPVVDPSEWGQPQPPYFLPPPLVRGPGRPRKERIHDPDEKRPHKRCGTCGCFGHNKATCKGPPVGPTKRVVRTRQRLDTNTSRVNFMINISLQVDAGGERDAGGARGEGRAKKIIVGGRTSARGGRRGGKTRGGGRTGRNAVGGENVKGRTGTRGGGARGGAKGRAKQTFQAPRQSEGVTQVSTSQAPRHSQGDTQVSQS
ncbi:hypothetical protein GIB67_027280 [Kingdonia uniflora]|uniref:Transposase MuDR plant domain-containing protein n=1 Tax=Kingdonia uniflora TaxID=39325 RepID=A0A7J7KYG1_9MAGN|nr:hypothetical protein GIB67_027280 [Kingdonia uniflora]